MSLLQNSNAIEVGGYTINNSLRFRSSASAWMNRTPAGAGTSNKIMTFSAWVKRGAFATLNGLFTGSGGTIDGIQFWNNNIDVYFNNGTSGRITTNSVYRDPSAWYHIVVTIDTTQATAADRVKIYVNSTQITSTTGGAPAQNYTFSWNQNVQQRFATDGGSNFFDGYFAEVNVIDGQALTPSSFGQTDTLTGVWTAKKYTGTYGTNGFYLPFSDTTSATTLAYDKSGNGNNWTPNNISTTAGVTYDAMIDSPTMGASGTQPVGNYAVANPLDKGTSFVTVTNGNLTSTTTVGGAPLVRGSMGVTSGKWYWEITPTSMSRASIGIANNFANPANEVGGDANSWGYLQDARKYNGGTATSYGATYANNDVIGVALDMDAGTLTFYKNGVSQGQAFSGITGNIFPACSRFGGTGTDVLAWNFGQRPFSFSLPTGYNALCTTNLP